MGVEQTANSKCLTEYSFPRRSVLLLGYPPHSDLVHMLLIIEFLHLLVCRNEREGIPAEFLPLLDECVEIPQLGIIRSLNVHVSGALLVWEYTQQWRRLGPQSEQMEASQ